MRQYTIANTLALFLGVFSVVARSLPERRLEINARSPGDVGNPNQRLEELGLVKVSEGVLNGNIHTSSHSMSNKTTFPKRDTTLVDVQGNLCSTFCFEDTVPKPDSTSCEALYEDIKSEQGTFTVEPSKHYYRDNEGCAAWFINTSPDTAFIYDFWDFGATMEWLTGECFIRHDNTNGYCVYQDTGTYSPYVLISSRPS